MSPRAIGPRSRGRLLHAIGLVATLVFTIFPFFWMVSSSFKTQTDLLASPPVWLFRPTLANYADVFADQYRAGDVELELVPQGTLVERIRARRCGSSRGSTRARASAVSRSGSRALPDERSGCDRPSTDSPSPPGARSANTPK